MRFTIAVAVACLSVLGVSRADTVQASIKKHTEIPAQALGTALQALAKDREFQIVCRADLVADIRSDGISGEFTAGEALARLLSGTNLTYRYLDEKTVTILPVNSVNSINKLDGNGPLAGNSQRCSGLSSNKLDSVTSLNRTTSDSTAIGWTALEGASDCSSENSQRNQRLASADAGVAGEPVQNSDGESSLEKDSTKSVKLEEILVTAQKREERLQDVPISITAITASEIARRGLTSSGDYLRGIPSVNQQEQAYGGQAVVIRGLETNLSFQNYQGGQSLSATYFGETPMSSSGGLLGASADIKLVDIERVEVLRGPQGTAFGSASMTGVVRLIPVAPKLNTFEANLGAGFSATSGTGGDNHNLQGVVNIPLINDRLAIRATGYRYKESGAYRNRGASDPTSQALAQFYDVEAFAFDKDEVGSSTVLGGRIAALFQASEDLRFTLSYLRQEDELNGFSQATNGRYEQNVLGVAPRHVLRGQVLGVNDSQVDVANALMEYNLGWADLLATYSYIESDSDHAGPVGVFLVPWPASFHNSDPHWERSGEVRLATKFNGAWNFLAGLFADNHDDAYNSEWFWFGSGNFFANNTLNDYVEKRTSKEKSAFAEVSWQFLPRFTLTAGARAYDYERTSHFDAQDFGGFGSSSQSLQTDATGTNYRANLSFKPNDNTHVYASWAQGFRLGRPQQARSGPLCDSDGDGFIDGTEISLASTGSIDSDNVDNYELGAKFSLFNRRVNLDGAIFRMDWSGLPVAGPAPSIFCGGYFINVGAARSEGVEVQANVQITDKLRANLGGSYIDARITEDSPTRDLQADDRLAGAPKVTANLSLQQEFAIASHSVFVRADSIYVGPLYFGVGAERIYAGMSPLPYASGDYIKVDVTAGMSIRDLNFSVYVRNLTNEDAFTYRFPFAQGEFGGVYLRPRTVGVQLDYNFK